MDKVFTTMQVDVVRKLASMPASLIDINDTWMVTLFHPHSRACIAAALEQGPEARARRASSCTGAFIRYIIVLL